MPRGRLLAARLPRALHPGAWWLWALGLAAATTRTRNPVLLLLLAAVTWYVVAARRPVAPWAASYRAFLRLGLVVLAIRVVLEIVFGGGVPGHTLFRLPVLPLPRWTAGLRVGGTVTAEGVLAAAYDGLQLAVLLGCLGAANALASPARLLKLLPGALYEVGVAVTVAMSFGPQAVAAVGRIRTARRLRGRPSTGLRGLGGLALPVLEEALEASVSLAAAMDSRGFGRRAGRSTAQRRITAALTLTGLLALCAGTYGLLDASAPVLLGLPLLAGGTALAVAGLLLGGRRTARTRYRPDPWTLPEWLVAGCGVLAAAAVATSPASVPPALATGATLAIPAVPALALVGVLLGVLPAWVAPPLPRPAGVRR